MESPSGGGGGKKPEGTVTIIANGTYDITNYKNVEVYVLPASLTYNVHTAPVIGISYTDGLPNDWNVMKEIGQAISQYAGHITADTTEAIYVNKKDSWAYKITPGDTITVNGYQYAIMGFNNYQLTNKANYGGNNTYAGLTFGMVDICGSYKMNSSNTSKGGWGACLMKTSTMATLKNGMPSTMAQVKIPYYNYGGSSMLYSDDYMFLPAEKEVFGVRKLSPTGEANALTQYAYYKNGGSTIKKYNGSAVDWWLRSVFFRNSSSFCIASPSSSAGSGANYAHGVTPCFCV